MHIATTKCLGVDHLAGGRFHQGGSAKENGALVADDNGFVAHRGNVGSAGRAGTEHGGYLRDALRRHAGLVVEDAAEVVAIRKHFILFWQKCAAGIHEVNTWQMILFGHFLCTQVLLDGERVIGAAFDCRVVGDDHAVDIVDLPDAGNDTRGRHFVVVHAVSGKLPDFEKGRAAIDQGTYAIARQ